MKKYRIRKSQELVHEFFQVCNVYKVQVRKWYGWVTIKTYIEEYNDFHYAREDAQKLLELLELP